MASTKTYLLALLLYLGGGMTLLNGQNYLELNDYFEQQKVQVQTVLDGLDSNQYLQVKELVLFEDFVILELQLNASQDSAQAVWDNLKTSFAQSNPLDLEQWLFIKTAQTFALPYPHLRIRVSNRVDGLDLARLDGRIEFEETEQVIKAKFATRTIVKDSLHLESFALQEQFACLFEQELDEKQLRQEKHQIYRHLRDQAKAYFEGCPGSPEFLERLGDPLVFEVSNVKGEVVPLGNSFLGQMTNPHEQLYFILTLQIDEQKQSISCTIELDAKYGSGLFFLKPSVVSSYIDMAPRYAKDLEKYIRLKFQPRLQQWLRNEASK